MTRFIRLGKIIQISLLSMLLYSCGESDETQINNHMIFMEEQYDLSEGIVIANSKEVDINVTPGTTEKRYYSDLYLLSKEIKINKNLLDETNPEGSGCMLCITLESTSPTELNEGKYTFDEFGYDIDWIELYLLTDQSRHHFDFDFNQKGALSNKIEIIKNGNNSYSISLELENLSSNYHDGEFSIMGTYEGTIEWN